MRDNKKYKISDNDCVIVCDILRACSTIYYASYFDNKIKIIEPSFNINNIKALNNELLIGEEKGVKPNNFDFSNSPSTILSNDIKNKNILFSSTKGTKALFKFKCKNVFLSSLLNAKSLVKYLELSLYENIYLYPCNQIFNNNDEDYICCKYIIELSKNINFDFYRKFHKFLDKENSRFFKIDLQSKFPIFDFYLSFSLNIMGFVLKFEKGEIVKIDERN